MRERAPRSLITALLLMQTPALADVLRQRLALPGDLSDLIRIAGGCEKTTGNAAAALGRSQPELVAAARFYLEQVLFCVETDSYRVLGLTPDAPQWLVAEHGRWLMRWLHPDTSAADWEMGFGRRVVSAWNDLKTSSRRAAYDRAVTSERSRPFRRRPPVNLGSPVSPAFSLRRGRPMRGRAATRTVVALGVFLCVWLVPFTAAAPVWDLERACASGEGEDARPCPKAGVSTDASVTVYETIPFWSLAADDVFRSPQQR
ncbi:hypothetical protein ACSSVZ_004296 [Amorphus sp. MBR-141]